MELNLILESKSFADDEEFQKKIAKAPCSYCLFGHEMMCVERRRCRWDSHKEIYVKKEVHVASSIKPESIEQIKSFMVTTYRKIGDKKALITKNYIGFETSKNSYTGNEIADEIQNETGLGIAIINGLLRLSADLLSRDKLNINSPMEGRYLFGDSSIHSEVEKEVFDSSSSFTFDALKKAFEDGTLYGRDELELDTAGRDTAFEVWFENNYKQK